MQTGRSNKTRDKWEKYVAQWQTSGKNAKAWCREHDVPYVSFICWKNKLVTNTKVTSHKSDLFLELSDSPSKCSGIKIQLHDIAISLSKDFDTHTLVRCIKALGSL
jgi:hypothetical protein